MKNIKNFDEFSNGTINEAGSFVMTMNVTKIDQALKVIATEWEKYKKGELTEPSHITPAAEDLKSYINQFMINEFK